MKEETENNPQEIKDSDIIFECPFCSKSLAIDFRAAGLSIPFTDCGKLVVVPVPDGMELSDLDSTAEEQGAMVIHLRETLSDSQTRVRLLEVMVTELQKRRKQNEQREAELAQRAEQLSRDVEIISRSVDQINAALASMALAIREGLHSKP